MSKDKDQAPQNEEKQDAVREMVIVNEEESKYVHIPYHERYDGYVADYFQTQVPDINIIGTVMEKPVLRYEENGLFCTYLYVATLHQTIIEPDTCENHTTSYVVEIWSNMPGGHLSEYEGGNFEKAFKCEVGAKVYVSGFLKVVEENASTTFSVLQAKCFEKLVFYGDRPKNIYGDSIADAKNGRLHRLAYSAQEINACKKGVTLEEFIKVTDDIEDSDLDKLIEEKEKVKGRGLLLHLGFYWEHCSYASRSRKEDIIEEPFWSVPTQPDKPPEDVKKKTLTRQERKKLNKEAHRRKQEERDAKAKELREERKELSKKEAEEERKDQEAKTSAVKKRVKSKVKELLKGSSYDSETLH